MFISVGFLSGMKRLRGSLMKSGFLTFLDIQLPTFRDRTPNLKSGIVIRCLLMHFNEGQGAEAQDSSAFEHHGLIDGATWEEVEDAPFKALAVEPGVGKLSTTWGKLKRNY